MGWSISPNDTASINETTGVASFSANTEATDKKYTVTYTDEYSCSNSLEYTVPAFRGCNPNPTFSNLTCDANGRHECTITTTNPCTTAVINYTLTDSAGNIASGGVNITKIGDYTFTASTTMVAGNVTVKWWNTADTSVSGTSTITSPGECTPSSTCELIVSSAENPDTIFPCDGGEISGWACYYEVITTTAGVTSKTAEGSAIATFTVGGNCDGTERELDIEQSSASSLIIDKLVDDGTDILLEYSDCAVSGKFKQEGKPDVIIRSCDEITWEASGMYVPASYTSTSKIYNRVSNDTFSAHITYNGEWVYCKSSSVAFYVNGFTPHQDSQGNWVVVCDCCTEPQSCTGGTSGDVTENGAYLVKAVVDKSGSVEAVVPDTSDNASLVLDATETRDNFVQLNLSATTDRFVDDCCNNLGPGEIPTAVGVGAIITFEFYKNQTKKSGDTMTCSFDVYYSLGNNSLAS